MCRRRWTHCLAALRTAREFEYSYILNVYIFQVVSFIELLQILRAQLPLLTDVNVCFVDAAI